MRRGERGFTLLELLVALALLGLIGVTLARTMGVTVEVWKRSSAQEARMEQVIVRNKLREWIERAKPADRRIGLRQQATGDAASFTFLTTKFLPINKVDTETEIGIRVLEGEIVVDIRVLDENRSPKHNETRVLIEGIDGRLRYYERAERDGRWTDTWPHEDRLPDLISIEVSVDNSLHWPPFVAAPLLN